MYVFVYIENKQSFKSQIVLLWRIGLRSQPKREQQKKNDIYREKPPIAFYNGRKERFDNIPFCPFGTLPEAIDNSYSRS